MKKSLCPALLLGWLLVSLQASGQQKDYTLLKSDSIIRQFDSLFLSDDSLSLFRLIDSLVQMPEIKEKSQLALRLGYNSNVVATSRTVGINQFGLAPGLAYYHKSGLYADATTYWSQQYCPNVYLSVGSVGYLKTVTTHWSFLAEYSHYYYTPTAAGNDYAPYTNNVGASNYFDVKPFTFRLDYYYYFGEKGAHRIAPGITFTLQKKHWLGLDRITLFPSFNTLFGSEDVVTATKLYPDVLSRIKQNKNLPAGSKLPYWYDVHATEFGVMNYSFTAPLSITRKNWNLLIAYTYNIPRSLPYEDVGLKNGGYLSFSVSKYLEFRAK